MDRKRLFFGIKFLIFLMFISMPIIFAIFLVKEEFNIDKFLFFILSFGYLAPLGMFILIVITSSIGFPFIIPVAFTALIFDYFWALTLSYMGLLVGSIASFYIIRYLGRDYFQEKFIKKREKIKVYDQWLEKNGFLTILIFRLIAFMPFELTNVIGALSNIKFRDYFFATCIGILPGMIIIIYFIKSLERFGSPESLIALFLLSLFSLFPLLFKKIRRLVFIYEKK